MALVRLITTGHTSLTTKLTCAEICKANEFDPRLINKRNNRKQRETKRDLHSLQGLEPNHLRKDIFTSFNE